MLLAQINYEYSCLSRWKIIARLSVLSFAVRLGFVPSKWSDVSETTNRKCTLTLSSWCWRHVWVPNNVQRNIQVKLPSLQPRKRVFSQYHNWAPQTANYGDKSSPGRLCTPTCHQGDLHEDTEGSLRGAFIDTKSIPSFPYSRLRLSASMINDSDYVPVFI